MTEVWNLQGTTAQNGIVEEALDRCTFPWEVLLPGLQTSVGRTSIPAEWADLSRYTVDLEQAAASGGHLHVHEGDDKGHPITRTIEGRERVLGLAWYSGKVTLDIGLENHPEVAMEVFLSEGAHMIDFFWMSEPNRIAVWNALHPDEQDTDTVSESGHIDHEHSWFDHGGYYSWVGEAWMGLFVKIYSDIPVTIDFDHPPTPEAIEETRHALTPYFWSGRNSGVFHDAHKTIRPAIYLPEDFTRYDLPDLRPCGTCDPLKG